MDARLRAKEPKRLALFVDHPGSPLVALTGQRWGRRSRVVVLSTAEEAHMTLNSQSMRADRDVLVPARRSHAVLTAYGPFDAIIDATSSNDEAKHARLKDTFFHLRRNGSYLLQIRRPEDGITCGDDNFAEAVSSAAVDNNGVHLLTNGRPALPKLRYAELDDLLEMRPDIGAFLTRLPELSFPSACDVTANIDRLNRRLLPTITVPSLGLRVYYDSICAPHQVLVARRAVLPDTYRHYTQPKLRNHCLRDVDDRFARYRRSLKPQQILDGEYFYLGSEHPQHFGHVMTEQLSRLWAWDEVKRRYPNARALVSLKKDRTELTMFELAIFQAAGVAPQDLFPVKTAVRVEKLLAAAPMFVNPAYAHPDLTKVWRRVGDALLAAAPLRQYPERIFVARGGTYPNRTCLNGGEVEQVFERSGYVVIYPEDYGLAEQAMMFDRARVVAGYAGSGLFNLIFSRSAKDVVLLTARTYAAPNEYLIASVLGHPLHLIWCEPAQARSAGQARTRFQSDFVFDFERDGGYLSSLLRRLG
ncbi:MAG TPA: glycosyltransferase 61 family protein [Propionibacteriaceae bacterium]|nr:glycosyltransferase 61 family protein [Propionibacteriaceae bacterium]